MRSVWRLTRTPSVSRRTLSANGCGLAIDSGPYLLVERTSISEGLRVKQEG